MKILTLIAFTLTAYGLFGQVKCSDFKTGKFVVKSDEMGNNYIERTEKYQIESWINPSTGKRTKTKDRIVWIDECS